MKKKAVVCSFVLSAVLLVGCSGEDGDNNGSANNGASNNGGSNNGASNNGASNNGASNNGSGSGEFLRATGSRNGAAFSVDCDPDDAETSSFTSGKYLGHDSCFPSVGNHQIQCATTEEGIGGVMGTIIVNLSVNETGDHSVNVSGSLETVNNLTATSANVVDNTLTTDFYELGVGASGTFTASWEDDGGPVYGDVTGSFNFRCDE